MGQTVTISRSDYGLLLAAKKFLAEYREEFERCPDCGAIHRRGCKCPECGDFSEEEEWKAYLSSLYDAKPAEVVYEDKPSGMVEVIRKMTKKP